MRQLTDSGLGRRQVLRLLLSSASVALLDACATASAPTSTPPTAGTGPAAQPPAPVAPTPRPAAATVAVSVPTSQPQQASATNQAQPRSGGILRTSIPADVANVDGHSRTTSVYESIWLIFDRLIAYDQQLVPQPMLAESWDLNSDYTQIKFSLRSGVQWHSGREFTSDDVKYNLLRVRDPKVGAGNFTNQSNWFTTIDTPDKNTIVLQSDQPRPALFDLFENLNMVDKDTVDGPDKSKSVGTGPFALSEWAQGDHLTLTKNANYWQNGRPYLDGIQSSVHDEQAALTQLEAGALDVVRTTSVRDIVRLKADPNYLAVVHPNPGTILEFAFEVEQPPFDNKLVRQAMNYAIDRQRLVGELYQGTNVPLELPWFPSSPAYDAVKNQAYGFDLDKARSLLAQANATDVQTEIIIQTGAYPPFETFLQAYQADLATIGVKLTVTPMDGATWIASVVGHKFHSMYATGDNSMNLNPATPMVAGPTWKYPPNNTGFNDQTWTDLLNSVSSETDPTRQRQLFAQLDDFILDQCWAVPVCSNPVVLMTTASVNGVVPTMHQGFLFTDASLSG